MRHRRHKYRIPFNKYSLREYPTTFSYVSILESCRSWKCAYSKHKEGHAQASTSKHKEAESTRAIVYLFLEKINPTCDIITTLKCSSSHVLLRAKITCDAQAVGACSRQRARTLAATMGPQQSCMNLFTAPRLSRARSPSTAAAAARLRSHSTFTRLMCESRSNSGRSSQKRLHVAIPVLSQPSDIAI